MTLSQYIFKGCLDLFYSCLLVCSLLLFFAIIHNLFCVQTSLAYKTGVFAAAVRTQLYFRIVSRFLLFTCIFLPLQCAIISYSSNCFLLSAGIAVCTCKLTLSLESLLINFLMSSSMVPSTLICIDPRWDRSPWWPLRGSQKL